MRGRPKGTGAQTVFKGLKEDILQLRLPPGDNIEEPILEKLNQFENFHYLENLEYPDKVREYLTEIDVYALITGMDLAPLSLKEA